MSNEEFEKNNVFGKGNLNVDYAKYFTGNSYLNMLTGKDDYLPICNVTFEPGCRNNWHVHNTKYPVGQILICTAGEGWYQEYGKEAVEMIPGSVIEIPSGVKHWHGAKKDKWFSHITFSVSDPSDTTDWLEEVSDEEYNRLK